MGRILKIDGDYYVEFYGNGLKFQKKAGATRQQAEEKLKMIEQSMAQTALDVDIHHVTVDQFLVRFRQFGVEVYPKKTMHRFNSAIDHFNHFARNHLSAEGCLIEINPHLIEQYREALLKQVPLLKPHLINFTLYCIREVLEYSRTLGWLNDNPTIHTKWLDDYKPHPKVYHPDQLIELMQSGSEEERICATFITYTGLTENECRALRWEDIDFNEKKIHIQTRIGSDILIRTLPMDHLIIEMLSNLEKKKTSRLVFDIFCLHGDASGAVLRNTFAKNLLERGVSLAQLNRYLGLDDLAKVFRYYVFIPAK